MGVLLTQNEMKEFTKYLRVKQQTYKKNEVILRRKPGAERVGLVLSGTVYLCAENPRYERSILQIFYAGAYLSQDLLMHIPGGICYLMAKYPSRIAFTARSEIEGQLEKNPRLFRNIALRLLDQTAQAGGEQLYWLHQKSIRSRLLCYLETERIRQGKDTVVMPVPFTDLAEYLAVERTALMRELGKLKKEGLVEGSNHTLTLRFASSEEL